MGRIKNGYLKAPPGFKAKHRPKNSSFLYTPVNKPDVLSKWSTHTMSSPAENERQRYLLELLDTLARTIERQTKRIQHETREDLNTLLLVLGELRAIRQELEHPAPAPPPASTSTVTGGSILQTGNPMLPITPGNSPQFAVTPTFSGASFTTLASAAAVTSSDPTNFPVALNSTDPTGLTFTAAIPTTATPTGGSEVITVTWTYTNLDGTVATVTGTVTETGIVTAPSDVTGGTFAQIV